MHLAPLPLAFVLAAVFPREYTETMPLIIQVVTLVYASVRPCVLSLSMHVVREPVSLEFTAVQPFVGAFATHLVVHPVARVEGPVRPEVCPETVFFALLEVAIIPRTISPAFDSLAVIKVVLPSPDELLLASIRHKLAEPVGLVVLPVTFIDVPIRAPELAFAVGLVVEPLAFILGLVVPYLNTVGALASFLVDVARVESALHDLQILDVLQLKLVDHLLELRDLLVGARVILFEVTCCDHAEVVIQRSRDFLLLGAYLRCEVASMAFLALGFGALCRRPRILLLLDLYLTLSKDLRRLLGQHSGSH